MIPPILCDTPRSERKPLSTQSWICAGLINFSVALADGFLWWMLLGSVGNLISVAHIYSIATKTTPRPLSEETPNLSQNANPVT